MDFPTISCPTWHKAISGMLLPLLATIVKVTPSNCVIDYRFFIHFFPDGVSV